MSSTLPRRESPALRRQAWLVSHWDRELGWGTGHATWCRVPPDSLGGSSWAQPPDPGAPRFIQAETGLPPEELPNIIPDVMGLQLMQHAHTEVKYLSRFLPSLYTAENRDAEEVVLPW